MNSVAGPSRCNGKQVLKKMNHENSDDTRSSDKNELSYKENKCENLKKRKRSQQSDDSAKFQKFARSLGSDQLQELPSSDNNKKTRLPKKGIHLKTFLSI